MHCLRSDFIRQFGVLLMFVVLNCVAWLCLCCLLVSCVWVCVFVFYCNIWFCIVVCVCVGLFVCVVFGLLFIV